ncbi:hypothetical protein BDR26DRAFT_870474 [Obelidium mucronatum]|nr:hypothetical protein BDR26DRAFT_870474 [Obelidium mucronatum]
MSLGAFAFDHLRDIVEEEPIHRAFLRSSYTLTPYLFPEIWSRIFALACGNIKQLARMSLLCRSVYYYCWKSPQFDLVLNSMSQNGARYSCLDRPQGCPLLLLSQSKTKDPIALIKMFYECKPHVSDEHLGRCLSAAVKDGNFEIMCALLQLDPTTASPTQVVSKLTQVSVEWNFADLTRRGHKELAMFLSMADNYPFVPKAVASAIKENLVNTAKVMIRNQITPPQTQLSADDSDFIWMELNLRKLEEIRIALEIAAGSQYGHYFDRVRLREVMQELKAPVLDELAVPVVDLLNVPIDSIVIANAAGSGNLPLLEHLNYAQRCVVTPLAVHNALVHRDRKLVKVLLDACSTWNKQNTDGFMDGSPLFSTPLEDDDWEFWPNIPHPCPIDSEDELLFEILPQLAQLGVYGASVCDNSLEELAMYSFKWTMDDISTAVDKLLAIGASVTSACLYNATFNGQYHIQMTTRFPLFLEKFEFDPAVEYTVKDNDFSLLKEFANSCYWQDPTDLINLVLAKGFRPCMDTLYAGFRSRCGTTHLKDGLKTLFASISPDSEIHWLFFENMAHSQLQWDILDSELDQLQDLLAFLRKLGFYCTQDLVEEVMMKEEGMPNFVNVLKQMVR